MRLIDADMLTERITMLNDADLFTIGRVIASIDTQPTAYDIDKVVEELEEATFYDESGVHTVIGSGRAIEIVKEGGKEC